MPAFDRQIWSDRLARTGRGLAARRGRVAAWLLGAATVIVALVVVIAVLDWNWLRGPISSYASGRTGRDVRIEGNLHVRLLTWSPEARVGGLKIGHPKWMRAGETIDVQGLTLRVKLLPLLVGRVELPLVDLDHPRFDLYRDQQGRVNWTFSRDPQAKPARLPPIQNFIIRDGALRLRDLKRGLSLDGTLQSREAVASGGAAAFSLIGRGRINREPFALTVKGGPLINVRRDRPYRFDADMRAGATQVSARGALPRPFDFGLVDARLRASGSDLARLHDLTSVAMPNTPPYSLAARLKLKDDLYAFTGLGGRVGDSDLRGELSVDASSKRPRLRARLVSRSLDFDDLATVFGAAPDTRPGETASPEQRALARRLQATGRYMPDTPLDPQRLRAIDADVRFRADAVRTRRLDVRSLSFHIVLDRGRLVADPVSLRLSRGALNGRVVLDGRKAVARTDADVRLTGARVEAFLPRVRGSEPVIAPLYARARLTGSGNSVHKAAASANGSLSLVAPAGNIREAFAELLGINVAPGLFQLLAKDQGRANLRCAVAHFDVGGGVARGRRIVIDTNPVLVEGEGRIDLGAETLDLRLRGKSKRPRILSVNAPIRISGRIAHPQIKAELSKAAPQAGIAGVLGVLVSPLAAILPFVDPGLAKDANCSSLIAGAGGTAAPVRVARR